MYFGESKDPISRKHDLEKEQLAEQNALLKKLLQQQAESAKKRQSRRKLVLNPLQRSRPAAGSIATLPRSPMLTGVSLTVVVVALRVPLYEFHSVAFTTVIGEFDEPPLPLPHHAQPRTSAPVVSLRHWPLEPRAVGSVRL